ncbi:amidohydrolase family protein [Roseivirga sp.]|uniref:amidohydrolase family protein n=1 Tax=Roseivirga sp. TaxID=1964215 RepID=UPI002B2722FA|nr:amidohydrolase family protein [Roseivirga sp.]
MKLILRILKIIGKSIAFLLLAIIVYLTAAILVGRMELGSPGPIVPNESKVAFTHVNIIPMDSNHVLMDKTVLVENGIITGIYEEFKSPKNTRLVDGQYKYLVPGLMDAHAHIFDRSDLALNLSQGVTTVRNMMGFPMHLRWRDEVNNNLFPGAYIYTAGPTLNMGSYSGPFHKVLKNSREGRKAVRLTKSKGYDFVKIYDGLTEEAFKAIMDEAKLQSIKVAGHPPRAVNLETLANSDIVSIEHAEEIFQGMMNYKYSPKKTDSIAKILSEKEIYVTPTLIIYNYLNRTMNDDKEFLDSIPQEYINPLTRFIGNKQLGDYLNMDEKGKKYSASKNTALSEILSILHQNNVPLLLGTDSGPNLTVAGYILHSEIDLWKKAGIEDYEIIKAGTINVAKALDIHDEVGTIEVGKRADFILVDQNPLEDARNLRKLSGVFHNSGWYNSEKLKELEEIGKDKSSWFSTIGRFMEYILFK